jgi:hypothetical protein
MTNLERLAEDVAKATWVRKRRVDLVSMDATVVSSTARTPDSGKVDLIFDVERRKGGWDVLIDIGGVKRFVPLQLQLLRVLIIRTELSG